MRILKSLLPATFTAMLTLFAVLSALLLVSLLSTLSYAATPDRISGALTTGQTVALKGNVHRRALPQFDRGAVDPAMPLGTITLMTSPTLAQTKALTQLLAQLQDRKSPNYHKWLTPEQFADRFGLSQKDMQQMAAWLKAQGFSMVHQARGRNWISFTGTAAQVQSAFRTEIHHYYVNGELHYANATAPVVPAALRGVVTGLRGLHDFLPRPMGIRRNAGVRPYYNSSVYGDLVAPGDIATIYDINALYNAGIDGTGQKLAVMGRTDIYLADIADFRTGFGLSAVSCTTNSNGVITACSDPHFSYKLYGSDPGLSSSGDISEANLDLEWSGAVARGAQLIYVNSTDTFTSFYNAINDNLAPVISLSYGFCEYDDNFVTDPTTGLPGSDELELMQANSQGITFVNSSGDSGAAECDPNPPTGGDPNGASATGGLAVSYPASSPEVTGVGGTAIPLANFTSQYWNTPNPNPTDGGTAISYIPEQVWNDDAEIAQYCQQNVGSTFCTQGGTNPVSGWVPIIDAATAQQDIGISSTGGGASNCSLQTTDFSSCVSGFPKPSWQTVTISGHTTRLSPDVSFLATPNFPGYIYCTELSELGLSGTGSSCSPGGSAGITNALNLNNPSIIGGTSASAPVFAGIVTLLNQYLASSGGLGNVNPSLYALADPSNAAFNAVTTGDNTVQCTAGQPTIQPVALQCPSTGVLGFQASDADATTGYNLVAGLGSVDVNNLAVAWAASLPAGFTLTPTAASYQVAQGSPIDSTVTVALAGGFSGTIHFTCTDPAPESICTAPPDINATASTAVSFHITTTAPTVATLRPSDQGTRILYAALLPGLLGIIVTAGSRRRSVRGIRFLGLIVVLGFLTLWLASCGGSSSSGNSNPGTTKGTYTINVTGTSGSSTATTSFQIVVQ